jgi:hypothetical protein
MFSHFFKSASTRNFLQHFFIGAASSCITSKFIISNRDEPYKLENNSNEQAQIKPK